MRQIKRTLYWLLMVVLSAALTLCVTAVAAAQAYTVSPSGDSTGAADTAALQAALDAGGKVTLAPGEYTINKRLIIRQYDTTISAEGATVTQLTAGTGIFKTRTDDAASAYNGVQGLVISGGTWRTNAATPSSTYSVFHITHAQDVRIENVTIVDIRQGHLIELSGVKDAVITGCKLGVGGAYGSASRNFEAIQLDTTHSSAMVGAMTHYDDAYCQNILIEDNVIEHPRGIGSHGLVQDHHHTGVTVRSNTITADVGGIAFLGVKDLLIERNTIDGAKIGIEFNTSSIGGYSSVQGANQNAIEPSKVVNGEYGLVIRNNTVTGGSQYGVKVAGIAGRKVAGAQIYENTVKNTGAASILVSRAASLLRIYKNQVSGCKGSGVYAEYCENADIQGNTIRNAGKSGVGVVGCTLQALVKKNQIEGAAINGVYVTSSANVTVLSNAISQAGSNGVAVSGGAKGVRVGKNTIQKPGLSGVLVTGSADALVAYNEISGARLDGVTLDTGATGAQVGWNEISDVSRSGIAAAASRNIILYKNEIKSAGAYGIALYAGCTNAGVGNNAIDGTGKVGIAIRGTLTEVVPEEEPQPSEPTVFIPPVYEVNETCTGVLLHKNAVCGAAGGGVSIEYYTDVTVRGNQIVSANSTGNALSVGAYVSGQIYSNAVGGKCAKAIAVNTPASDLRVNVSDLLPLAARSVKVGHRRVIGEAAEDAAVKVTVNGTYYSVLRDGKAFGAKIPALKKGDVVKAAAFDDAKNMFLVSARVK